MEHQVELAYVLECTVQRFDEDLAKRKRSLLPPRAHASLSLITRDMAHLDQVQDPQLALRTVDDEHKVERRVAPVHDAQLLAVAVLGLEESLELRRIEEVAQACGPPRHECKDLLDEGLGRLLYGRVELGEAGHTGCVDCREVSVLRVNGAGQTNR